MQQSPASRNSRQSTVHSDSAWVCQQKEWFIEQTGGREKKPTLIVHDRDLKFTKKFTKTVKNAGLRTNLLPKGFANLNGRCERVIETIKLECLAKFIVFDRRHMGYLISEFTTCYNARRSHMERDVPKQVETLKLDEVVVRAHVGGLVKSFERKVA